jgi:hypothetical protein
MGFRQFDYEVNADHVVSLKGGVHL